MTDATAVLYTATLKYDQCHYILLSIPELFKVDSWAWEVFRNCFEARLLFRNTFGGGGRSSNIHQHPRVRPPTPSPLLRSAPCFLSAQRHPTVPFINVSSQTYIFPNSECRKTVEVCHFTPFCPKPETITLLTTPPSSTDFRGLKIYFGFIWQQLSKFLAFLQALHKLKSCCSQSVIQPQEPCRTWVQIQADS